MTKKHFEAIAKRLREDVESSARFGEAEQKRTKDAATYAAYLFADVASVDNKRFDRERFLKAAGVL